MDGAQYFGLLGTMIASIGLLAGFIRAEFKSLNARVDGLTARIGNLEVEVHTIQGVLMQPPAVAP